MDDFLSVVMLFWSAGGCSVPPTCLPLRKGRGYHTFFAMEGGDLYCFDSVGSIEEVLPWPLDFNMRAF